MNIDRNRAEQIILELLNRNTPEQKRFVIGSCERPPRGDCWVITANSAAYLERGDFSQLYVGVSTYLVDSESGEVEIVDSGELNEVLRKQLNKLPAEQAGTHHGI